MLKKMSVSEAASLMKKVEAFGITREKSLEILKVVFDAVGAEIDLPPPGNGRLDFTEPSRRQPLEQPLKLF